MLFIVLLYVRVYLIQCRWCITVNLIVESSFAKGNRFSSNKFVLIIVCTFALVLLSPVVIYISASFFLAGL